MRVLMIGHGILTAALGVTGSIANTSSAQSASASIATPVDTPTVAAALARAGYISASMRQNDYQHIATTIDTTPVSLLLDSGSNFEMLLDPSLNLGERSGVHLTDVKAASSFGAQDDGRWAKVDRVTIGTSALEPSEAIVETFRYRSITLGILGALQLSSQGMILDFATDTVYLLAPPSGATPVTRQTGTRFPTMRAALETAGRYRTFLALAQDAGMMPLLEGRVDRRLAADSMSWLAPRFQAVQLAGADTMEAGVDRLLVVRQALNRRLRRPGQLTAFVPTDAAFARLPADTLSALRADTARLARFLLAHLYPGAVINTAAMRALLHGAVQPGPRGSAFGFHVLGARIDVDRLTSWEEGRIVARATIVQPDLEAANGVAHGIDRVLGPVAAPSPFAEALRRQGYIGFPLYRREDGSAYYLRATLNGVPITLTVDTGAPLEMALDQRGADRLPPLQTNEAALALNSVEIGPTPFDVTDWSGLYDTMAREGFRVPEGIVGAVFLNRYHARLDFGNGMLYLRLPTTVPTTRPTP